MLLTLVGYVSLFVPSQRCTPSRTSVNMCARCWALREDRRLSLLPFPEHEAMLPGDTQKLVLRAEKDILLLAHACNNDDGVFGQLLNDGAEAHIISPLLQIMEIREPGDSGGVEGAIWTEVKCVSRVRIGAPARGDENFFSAEAHCVADDPPELQEKNSELDSRPLGAELLQALNDCRATEWRLESRREPPLRGPVRGEPGVQPGLAYGARSARAELSATLDEQVRVRRAALQQRGLDEPAARDLAAVHDLWGVDDEAGAAAQLRSWAACAWADGETRLQALLARSEAERFSIAIGGLVQRKRAMETELALETVLGR